MRWDRRTRGPVTIRNRIDVPTGTTWQAAVLLSSPKAKLGTAGRKALRAVNRRKRARFSRSPAKKGQCHDEISRSHRGNSDCHARCRRRQIEKAGQESIAAPDRVHRDRLCSCTPRLWPDSRPNVVRDADRRRRHRLSTGRRTVPLRSSATAGLATSHAPAPKDSADGHLICKLMGAS